VTGGAKVATFARKGQKVFMATIFALHTGKAVVQIAAIQIPINHLLNAGCQNPYCLEKCSS
jgi:hypothetical protein